MENPALHNIQVSRNRLSEQVADQLKALMISKTLKPGDRLPAERALSDQLGVSRSIIREAIKLLEQQGLLSVEVGRGTFVTQVQPEDITDALSVMMRQRIDDLAFEYVYEIRQMIEIESARYAALRATEADCEALRQYLNIMVAGQDDIEKFTWADTEYHKALARATQNPLFLTLLMPITGLLRQIQRQASRNPGGRVDAIRFHTEIVEAVCRGDAEASAATMRAHLESVLKWLETDETEET